jgi:hypothetical protein
VDKRSGGWERNTLRKPAMILKAMRRHPEKSIIFLDVDAVVHEPLDELAAIPGDIGLHLRIGIAHTGRPRLGMRSGTMVLRRTDRAASFLRRWAELSECARGGISHCSFLAALRTFGLFDQHHPNDEWARAYITAGRGRNRLVWASKLFSYRLVQAKCRLTSGA